MATTVAHLSALVGSPLLDSGGERLGRVQDVVARLDESERHPLVVGLKARVGGRELFVPVDRLERLAPGEVRTATTKLNLAQFERRPGEVLLGADLLDRSVIDVATARLVRAREVELVREHDGWRVAGIDPGVRPRLFRLLPHRFRGHDSEHAQFVAWDQIEPFVAHVPTSRLKLASPRLIRLHPAQIADLVEAASHDEGEEILEAVARDRELEADVFEELDDEHQVEFLRDRPDAQVAGLLARMATDDAADLLLELQQERRRPILDLLPEAPQRKIRGLLSHNPATAGGLMNADFVAIASDQTVQRALATWRATEISEQQASVICVIDGDGRLAGSITLGELVRARAGDPVSALCDESSPRASVDADIPEVARVMSDYNLIALPVCDEHGRPVGIVAVDDVLELLIPADWRRRAGLGRQ